MDLIWLQVDPLLKGVNNSFAQSPDYAGAEKHITFTHPRNASLALPQHRSYQRCVESALRMAAEQVSDDEISLIRLAALFHDAGFIRGAKVISAWRSYVKFYLLMVK